MFTEMVDPSVQYLESCPRIGTPRFRGNDIQDQEDEWKVYVAAQRKNLPSPSAQIDEKNIFSVDKLDTSRKVEGENGERRLKKKKLT